MSGCCWWSHLQHTLSFIHLLISCLHFDRDIAACCARVRRSIYGPNMNIGDNDFASKLLLHIIWVSGDGNFRCDNVLPMTITTISSPTHSAQTVQPCTLCTRRRQKDNVSNGSHCIRVVVGASSLRCSAIMVSVCVCVCSTAIRSGYTTLICFTHPPFKHRNNAKKIAMTAKQFETFIPFAVLSFAIWVLWACRIHTVCIERCRESINARVHHFY